MNPMGMKPPKKRTTMYFPEGFVSLIVILALFLIGAAAIMLLVLLIIDIKNKKVW